MTLSQAKDMCDESFFADKMHTHALTLQQPSRGISFQTYCRLHPSECAKCEGKEIPVCDTNTETTWKNKACATKCRPTSSITAGVCPKDTQVLEFTAEFSRINNRPTWWMRRDNVSIPTSDGRAHDYVIFWATVPSKTTQDVDSAKANLADKIAKKSKQNIIRLAQDAVDNAIAGTTVGKEQWHLSTSTLALNAPNHGPTDTDDDYKGHTLALGTPATDDVPDDSKHCPPLGLNAWKGTASGKPAWTVSTTRRRASPCSVERPWTTLDNKCSSKCVKHATRRGLHTDAHTSCTVWTDTHGTQGCGCTEAEILHPLLDTCCATPFVTRKHDANDSGKAFQTFNLYGENAFAVKFGNHNERPVFGQLSPEHISGVDKLYYAKPGRYWLISNDAHFGGSSPDTVDEQNVLGHSRQGEQALCPENADWSKSAYAVTCGVRAAPVLLRKPKGRGTAS